MTPSRRHDLLALGLLTAILTLLFADVLSGVNSFYSRDIAYGAYPERLMLRSSVADGEFPHWNRWVSAGQPLAANPGFGVFYPLTWLIALPSFQLGFHLLLLVHLYVAGWGMYALLRSLPLRAPAAFFGSLSFALGGVCVSLLPLHPLLFSLAWLPAICLHARRYLRDGSARDFALAAIYFGLQAIVGEVTILLQTGLILGIYALHATGPAAAWRVRLRALGKVGLLALAAILVAAVQLLPAADLGGDSVRAAGLPFESVTSWSFPAARLAELAHPNVLGHQQLSGKRVFWGARVYPGRGVPLVSSIYPGILMTALALAGILAAVRGRGVFLTIFGTAFVLALGAHTPLWRLLYDAGIARSVRYPEKFMLMAVFALTVFGAMVLDRLLAGDERVSRSARNVVLTLAGLLAAVALVAMTPAYVRLFAGLWNPPVRALADMLPPSRSGWLLAAARAGLLFILLRNLAAVRRPRWLALLGVLVLLDLSTLLPELAPRTEPAFYSEQPAVARHLPANRTEYRVFHIGTWRTYEVGDYFSPQPELYWIHRNAMYWMMPATSGLRTAINSDFNRSSLLATAQFVDATWALSRRREDWLSVVSGMSNVWFAIVNANPAQAYARARGDLRKIQPVSVVPLPHAQRYYFATQVERVGSPGEFVEKLARPGASSHIALVAGQDGFAPSRGVVRRVRETANAARIEVETSGRAFLVMSVTPHKYWRISVDGSSATAVTTNLGYQGVVVPSRGRHVVEMRYHNPLFAIGGAVSLATLLLLAFLAWRHW